MPLATMTSKGQFTLPKEVRESLGLKAGDKIDIRLEPNGTARILPVNLKVDDVFGMLSKYKKVKPVTVEQMDEGIREYIRKKHG